MDAEKEKQLTDKQRRFCEEYVIDWNGTRAAIAAGYSEKSARQVASDTLSKTYIKAYIKEIQKDLSRLTGVTAARNVLELAKVAYTNLSDLRKDWENFKDWDDLTADQKAVIAELTHSKTEFEGGEKNTIKIKTHDKLKAIAMLNKMLGFDQVEPEPTETQTNNLTVVIGANGIEQLPSAEDEIEDFTIGEDE